MSYRLGPVALLALIFSFVPIAQGEPPHETCLTPEVRKQLDAEIAKEMKERNLPGVAVSIVVPGEAPYLCAKGKANLATGTERGLDDSFRIASNTKTFVGLAILRLVDQGKLKKGDLIAKWFPDFPNADKITVDNLLRMQSGISDPFDKEWLAKYFANPLMVQTVAESIRLAAARKNEFRPPGKETSYCNFNFILLQEIAEKVSGKPIADLIQDEITKPLGLTKTFWPSDNHLPGPLRGYVWNAATNKFEDKTDLNPQAPGGAGAMISDLADLRSVVRALGAGKLLQRNTHSAQIQSQQLAGSPPFVRYGEAIGLIGEWRGHTGTITGFSTDMLYLPALDATVITSVNRLDLDDESQSTPLTLALIKLAFPKHVAW